MLKIKLDKYKKSFPHHEESFEYLFVKLVRLILSEKILNAIIVDYFFFELVGSGLV